MEITNKALKFLTAETEQEELSALGTAPALKCNPFTAPNHDPECKRNHLVLRFAYNMCGFDNWHVLKHQNPKYTPECTTTLSMRGLREWGFI